MNIAIVGLNSFIGKSFENYVSKYEDYSVKTIDSRNTPVEKMNFKNIDVVLHVAGIAHIKERKSNRNLYYSINRDLAIKTASKAKMEGVKQFIFLSTMSVYGINKGIINHNSKPNPRTAYGKSKFQAENKLIELEDNKFIVSVLRPPMVYGKGCRGNYHTLAKFALRLPFFPNIKNERSMLFIDNLSEYIHMIIDHKLGGIHLPQNKEYVCTSEMVRLIAAVNGKKIRLTKIFNPFIQIFKFNLFNKVFGSLKYEKETNIVKMFDFEETIKRTET